MADLVMVIEDEKEIRDLVRYNLEREGFRVTAVGDGEEGLRAGAQEREGTGRRARAGGEELGEHDVHRVSRGMGLMARGIEITHRQREVDGIDVVEGRGQERKPRGEHRRRAKGKGDGGAGCERRQMKRCSSPA